MTMRARLFTVILSAALPTFAFAKAEAPAPMSPEEMKVNDAQWQCEEMITKTLDYPSRSKFDYFGFFPTKKLPDGAYTVDATYQETEEAPKKTAQCILEPQATAGEWKLRSITPKP